MITGIFADCVREVCGTTDFQKIYQDANPEEKAEVKRAEKEVIEAFKKYLSAKNIWLINLEDYSKKVPLSKNTTKLAIIAGEVDSAVTHRRGSSPVEAELSGKIISFKPKKWPSSGPEVQKFVGKLANVMGNSKHMLANTYLLYGFTAPMAYRALNSKDDFQTAVRKDLRQALAQIENLKKNYTENELKAIGISRSDLERFAKMEYFDETTGNVILKKTSKIALLSEMIGSKAIDQAASNLPSQELSTLVRLQENISVIKGNKSIQENDLKLDSMDNGVVEKCTANFEQSIVNLPTRDQIETAKKRYEKLRTEFLNSLGQTFSQSTAKKLKTFLSRKNAPFFMPMSKEEFKSSFYARLQSFNDDQNVDRHVTAEHRDNAPLYFSAKTWNAGPSSLELKAFCDSLDFSTLRDHTSELGGIVVGSESIKDLEFGESVLIHELGHQVHQFLEDNPDSISNESKAKFQKMVTCLNGMHSQELSFHKEALKNPTKENEMAKKILLNESRYLGEDFSDMLSARGAKGNVGCKLVLVTQNSPDDLKNLNELDVHSSAIFRLLHIYKVKGWPPSSSCNQAMEKVKTTEKFEDCLSAR